MSVFDKSIQLNEDFKASVGKVPLAEQQRRRERIEKYDEDVLDPIIEGCARWMAKSDDADLATEFFKLLIDYENSAYETLSYGLGDFFLENPPLVERTLRSFTPSEQKSLYKQLDWGWQNVAGSGKVGATELANLNAMLKQLKAALGLTGDVK